MGRGWLVFSIRIAVLAERPAVVLVAASGPQHRRCRGVSVCAAAIARGFAVGEHCVDGGWAGVSKIDGVFAGFAEIAAMEMAGFCGGGDSGTDSG